MRERERKTVREREKDSEREREKKRENKTPGVASPSKFACWANMCAISGVIFEVALMCISLFISPDGPRSILKIDDEENSQNKAFLVTKKKKTKQKKKTRSIQRTQTPPSL